MHEQAIDALLKGTNGAKTASQRTRKPAA